MESRIRTEADVAKALATLAAADPRIAAAAARVGPLPLRIAPAGLEGLLRIVAAQQLSVASAKACFARVSAAFDPLTAAAILSAGEAELRAAGLSRQKAATFRAVAEAVAAGLDLAALADEPPETARAKLQAIRGVGRWTADIYLMFCLGHPDIFPVGDLAVRKAAAGLLALDPAPSPEALDAIAAQWAPHRSTAAYLMWAVYKAGPPQGFPL